MQPPLPYILYFEFYIYLYLLSVSIYICICVILYIYRYIYYPPSNFLRSESLTFGKSSIYKAPVEAFQVALAFADFGLRFQVLPTSRILIEFLDCPNLVCFCFFFLWSSFIWLEVVGFPPSRNYAIKYRRRLVSFAR